MASESDNPFLPPRSPDGPSEPEDLYATFRKRLDGGKPGRRLSGILLLVNATINLIATFTPCATPHPLAIGLMLLLAVLLIRGVDGAAGFALAWAAFGFLASLVSAVQGEWISSLVGVVRSVGLAFLLIGVPTKPRVIVGTTLFSLHLLISAAAVVIAVTSGQ